MLTFGGFALGIALLGALLLALSFSGTLVDAQIHAGIGVTCHFKAATGLFSRAVWLLG